MDNDNKKIKLKVKMQKYEDTTNNEFSKVKISVCTYDQIANNTKISRETLDSKMNKLNYLPVIGEFKEENDDFGSHGGKIELSDDGIKYIETTKPYGVVINNSGRWENIKKSNGDEIEYVVCDAYLWTKRYPELNVLFEGKDNAQSMEISILAGHNDENDVYCIDDFEYSALCILSKGDDGVLPAFNEAKISTDFSKESNFKIQYSKMMTALDNYLLNKDKEVIDLTKNKKEKNNKEEKMSKGKKENFSLSNNNLISEIRKILKTKTEIKNDYWGDPYEAQLYYYVDIKDNAVIVITNDYFNYYGIPFEEKNDIVVLDFDNKKEYISDWRLKEGEDVSSEYSAISEAQKEALKYSIDKATKKAQSEFNVKESEEYKNLNDDYEKINKELEELRQYKQESEDEKAYELRKTEVDKVIADFSFEDVDIKDLKEKAYNNEISTEELENDLYIMEGKRAHSNKNNFSKENKENSKIKITEHDEQKKVYGSADKYFNN